MTSVFAIRTGSLYRLVSARPRVWGSSIMLCCVACGSSPEQNDEMAPTSALRAPVSDEHLPNDVNADLGVRGAPRAGTSDFALERLASTAPAVPGIEASSPAADASANLLDASLFAADLWARPVGMLILPEQPDPSCPLDFDAQEVLKRVNVCKSGGPRILRINSTGAAPSLGHLLGTGVMSPAGGTGAADTSSIGIGPELQPVPEFEERTGVQFEEDAAQGAAKAYVDTPEHTDGAPPGESCASALTRPNVTLRLVTTFVHEARADNSFENLTCIDRSIIPDVAKDDCVVAVATETSMGALYLEGTPALTCIYRDPSLGHMPEATFPVRLWTPIVDAD